MYVNYILTYILLDLTSLVYSAESMFSKVYHCDVTCHGGTKRSAVQMRIAESAVWISHFHDLIAFKYYF